MKTKIRVNSEHVKSIRELSVLLGDRAYCDTSGYSVAGSDLGIPVYDSTRGKMYFWFGDTFSTANKIGDGWRSNTVGIVSDTDFSEGIKWERFLTDGDGRAREIIPSLKATSPERKEVTCIPTGGICIDGVHYCFYMSICEWKPGAGWDVNYCGLVKSEDGENFYRVKDVYFTSTNREISVGLLGIDAQDYERHNAPNYAQVFPIEKDGYVYLFGLPGGRKGAAKLARVKKQDIEKQERYQYFCDGEFCEGFSALQRQNQDNCGFVTDPFVGEISVCYCARNKEYFMTYLSVKDFSRETPSLVLRASKDLIHWSGEEQLITYYHYYKLYGGFMHEKLCSPDGKTMYLLLSQWVSPKKADHGYNVKFMEVTLR